MTRWASLSKSEENIVLMTLNIQYGIRMENCDHLICDRFYNSVKTCILEILSLQVKYLKEIKAIKCIIFSLQLNVN